MARGREPTCGAFDIQADFASLSISSGGASNYGTARIEFYIDANNYAYMGRRKSSSADQYIMGVVIDGTPQTTTATDTDASGKLRLVRKGQTVYGYYYTTTWVLFGTYTGFSSRAGYPRLYASSATGCTTTVRFDNYVHYESADALYPEHIVHELDGQAKDPPITVSYRGQRDATNKIVVEYTKPGMSSREGTAQDEDSVEISERGLFQQSIRLAGFRRKTRAKFMAKILLRKALVMGELYAFEVGVEVLLTKGGGPLLAHQYGFRARPCPCSDNRNERDRGRNHGSGGNPRSGHLRSDIICHYNR